MINSIYSAYKGYFQLGPGFLEQYLRKTAETQSNSQEIEQLKSVILQQSKLLDNLNGKTARYRRTKSDSRNVNSESNLENRCDVLEKQNYHISNHLNKLERKINLLKPLVTLAMLCCAFLALAVLLSFLI